MAGVSGHRQSGVTFGTGAFATIEETRDDNDRNVHVQHQRKHSGLPGWKQSRSSYWMRIHGHHSVPLSSIRPSAGGGLAELFEQQFTAQKVHRHKAARETTEIEQLLRDFAIRFPMLHVLSSTVNGLTHGGVSTV
jgi:hypothetical protein